MKYIIQGGLDFYKELNNSLNDNIELYNEDQKCLITQNELTEFYVKLNCGHKFNYGPLYKDIYNFKKKFNNMEKSGFKLKINEIRCPYCRKVQSELLPYHEILPYPKEHGVNYLDPNKNECLNKCVLSNHQCEYEQISTDTSGNTFVEKCYHYGYVQYKLKEKYNLTKKYCFQHKNAVLKELKEKEKEKIKMEKMLLKEELKKLKEINKVNKKSLKGTNENVIITDNLNEVDNSVCIQILKTGNRKGLTCSTNIYKDCLCKRHFNLKNKDIKIL
jgi:hypothetical protein